MTVSPSLLWGLNRGRVRGRRRSNNRVFGDKLREGGTGRVKVVHGSHDSIEERREEV